MLCAVILVWQIAILVPVVSSASFRFADNLLTENDQTLLADIAPWNPIDGSLGTKIWSRSDFLLSTFWKPSDGFDSSTSSSRDDNNGNDEFDLNEQGRDIYTYGEVTTMGVRQLAHALFFSLPTTDDDDVPTTTVFYDLGSGVGRLVTQMYLDGVVQKAVGVELSKERHLIATDDWSKLTSSLADAGGDNELFDVDPRAVLHIHGDATAVDLSDATHIFISSLCFPERVLGSLQDTILAVASLDVSRILVVAAMSDLWELEREGWVRTVRYIQMTWGSGLVRIYTRPMQ